MIEATLYSYFGLTGGIFLSSRSLADVRIEGNTVARNAAFQLAASQRWVDGGTALPEALRRAAIVVRDNDVRPEGPAEPAHVGWPPDDYTWAHAIPGDRR